MPQPRDHHEHDPHEHPGRCAHAHGEPPARAGAGDEGAADPGARHLAAALRTSFRLLGAIMVLGVLAFLGMGFQFVRPGEVAILTVFGRVVGVTPEGLAYNWPAPIGGIDKVSTAERTVALRDFWMFETKEDQLQPDLSKRQIPQGGLRPAVDGALLTGDRNLLHVQLKCTYAVGRKLLELPLPPALAAAADQPDRPVRAVLSAREAGAREHPVWQFLAASAGPDETIGSALARWRTHSLREPALLFRQNMADEEETMRSVLCDAAIRAAAFRTTDGLQRTERAAFERDVHEAAQGRLDALMSGIVIKAVKVDQSAWPLRTLSDYAAASEAVSRAETLKNAARGHAIALINNTAGPLAAQRLVGDPADVVARAAGGPPTRPADEEDYNVIGQYNQAVRAGQAERAASLLERIGNILVSEAAGGTVREVLGDARAYRTHVVQSVKARVNQFKELLPAYRLNPQFVLDRWWARTREEILNAPTAEKHYITEGDGKTVLRLSRDPAIVRAIQQELLKKKPGGGSPGGGEPGGRD